MTLSTSSKRIFCKTASLGIPIFIILSYLELIGGGGGGIHPPLPFPLVKLGLTSSIKLYSLKYKGISILHCNSSQWKYNVLFINHNPCKYIIKFPYVLFIILSIFFLFWLNINISLVFLILINHSCYIF